MKYKATVEFEIDSASIVDEVTNLIQSKSIQNLIVLDCTLIDEQKKIYCPKCGSPEGEVIADDFSNPGFVYCQCRACKQHWIMNDPASVHADHRKQRGRTDPR